MKKKIVMVDNYTRKKFEDMRSSVEIRNYLKKVLERPGTKKEQASLYHYTNIKSAVSIMESHCIWLGSPSSMNDIFEYKCIKDENMYMASFSKSEENLGMYKMYASGEDGVVIRISYLDAEQIITGISGKEKKTCNGLRVVRDNLVTDEVLDAEVYWTSVAYKDLHSDMIIADSVKNRNISNPFTKRELLGCIKLYGWEYEKEVRLIARLDKQLESNEKVAILLPESISFKVITGPEFDKKKYIDEYTQMIKMGVEVRGSSYESLVALGLKKDEKKRLIEEYEKEILNAKY